LAQSAPVIKILLGNYAHSERLMLFILVSERICPLSGRCHWEIVRPRNAQSHIPPDHAAKREPVGPSYHLHQFPQHSFVGQNRMRPDPILVNCQIPLPQQRGVNQNAKRLPSIANHIQLAQKN
jgi:hypothetical protein